MFGIVEQWQIQADTADDLRWIDPQFPQNLGNLDERTDPQMTLTDRAFLLRADDLAIDW